MIQRPRKPRPPRRSERLDSIETMMATRGSKAAACSRHTLRLLPFDAEELYTESATAARIIDVIPQEVTRCGFTIETEATFDHDAFRSWWEEMNGDAVLTQALIYSRLYGGAALHVMSATEGDESQPWRPGERPADIRAVACIELSPVDTAAYDPAELGMPEIWNVQPIYGGTEVPVHNSRLLKIQGRPQPVSWRRNAADSSRFFGMSALQGLGRDISDFDDCHDWATALLKRMQQGVWAATGLADSCETAAGERAAHRRMALVDGARSSRNTIAVDAETESYTLLTGSLAGVKDVLDIKKARLSQSTGIPAIVLAGDTSGGLNNSAAGALSSWIDTIARYQNVHATPVVSRLVSMQYPDVQDFTVSWNPITEETPAQRAERNAKEADADSKYIAAQTLTVDEVRDTLAKRGDYVLGRKPPVPAPVVTPEDANPKVPNEQDPAESD